MCSLPLVEIQDLGLISYATAWDYQSQEHRKLVKRKRENQLRADGEQEMQRHRFLLCEHPSVFTLGKSGKTSNLLLSEDALAEKGIEFYQINRGGDITFHGPGQLVGYPLFDLDEFFTDVHRYVRSLEEAIIRTLKEYGLEAIRMPGFTGVWLPADQGRPFRKICAIGVHLSRWVTMHGFALNVNTDLSYFDFIIPCGISEANMQVTTLAKELAKEISLAEVKSKVVHHFSQVFGFQYRWIREDLLQ